ncbi:hypothetical protein CVT26_015562 [Gymnopilus dilepis]|uniref:Anaphase-promoting complex subunit 4 WD40 domain-containing protein n=1 Tax=Gymnopilus dilepis TaxID=231916 RepID=A0A409YD75_9AGAR|nr:hypothetical protein CVT26_015562 [Gymnopilus dilepis]
MAPLPSSLEDIRQFSVPLPQEFDAQECIGVGCSATHMVLGFPAHIYIYSWPSFDLTHTVEPGKPCSFDRFAVHGGILLIAYQHFRENHLSDDFSVQLWNLSTGESLVTLRMSGFLFNTMLSVPRTEFIEMEENSTSVKREWPLDLTLLAASDGDQTLRVYTFPRSVNQNIEDVSVERSPVSTIHLMHQLVCLTSLGRTVVTGGHDFTVRLWDSITGECQLVLIGHTTKGKPCLLSCLTGLIEIFINDSEQCQCGPH